ncbi:MAG: DnaD domain protein [Clostridia bacterium]|nr:DnaD domain protein [Clostridia bacterium]
MEPTILFESSQNFSVPCDVVDKHLSAPDVELRLLLLLLRNANAAFLKDDLMRTLSVDEPRLNDAFHYWIKAGVLYKAAGKYTLQRPQLKASDFMTYHPETVAQRLEGDVALQFLYKEAETALKKPLTSADASLILSLVDWCGLPANVVALLIRYGCDNGKSLRQIAQTGIKWADDGVQTFEQAEELIRKESEKKNTVNRIASRFGILGTRAISEAERNTFVKWHEELGYELDMIGLAYEETIKNTGKYTYTYIDKILVKWHEAGYKTPEQAQAAPKPEQKTQKRTQTRRTTPNNPKKSTAANDALDLAWEIAGGD